MDWIAHLFRHFKLAQFSSHALTPLYYMHEYAVPHLNSQCRPIVFCTQYIIGLQINIGCFIIFPKSRNTFQYPLSKRVCKRLPKRLSRVVAFIIELYRKYESRGRPCHCTAALRSLTHRAFVGHMPLRRSVGDIKAFQNNFALSSLQKRVLGSNAYQNTLFQHFRKAF